VLSTCNHEAITEHADVDPLEWWKIYGSIQNSHIQVCYPHAGPLRIYADATVAKDPQKRAPSDRGLGTQGGRKACC
jgi:hypothetical protein